MHIDTNIYPPSAGRDALMEQTINFNKRLVIVSILGCILRGVIWIIGGIVNITPIELYAMMFFSIIVIVWILHKEWSISVVFWSAILFVFLAFGHMEALSIISLIYKMPLYFVYEHYYVFLAITAEVFMLGGIALCGKSKIIGLLQRLNEDRQRFRQFCIFLLFAVVYYMFDSIIISFDLRYWQITLFMLVSALLINIQIVLFGFYSNQISKISHYETEYLRLEEERAQQVQREFQLKKLAYKDTLTGAYNRRYIKEMLNSMMQEGKKITVAYIDINGLKKVNDTMGHGWGDKYLQTAADCINHHLHQVDVLARIGGDEFVVVSGESDENQMSRAMVLANEELSQLIHEFDASFSFGVVQSNGNETDPDEIMEKSDKKMYVNKTAWKQRGA